MRRLKIGDRVLRVRDEGEGKKLPLVFVHGAGSSSVMWMDAVRRLAPRRRVVAPDLPGHGQSDRWHPPSDVSIAMYRDAIGTVCANLQLAKVVLVGHSMGALIALACAAEWPDRVGGVVMVGGGAQIPVAPRVFEVLASDFVRAGEWLARVAWSPSTAPEIVERWKGLSLTADQDIALADFHAVARFDGSRLTSKVGCPTLVLCGADDLMTPPALTHALGAQLRGAEVEVVPHAGHMLMLEKPGAFHAALDRFLLTVP